METANTAIAWYVYHAQLAFLRGDLYHYERRIEKATALRESQKYQGLEGYEDPYLWRAKMVKPIDELSNNLNLLDNNTREGLDTLKVVDVTSSFNGTPTKLLYGQSSEGPLVMIRQHTNHYHYRYLLLEDIGFLIKDLNLYDIDPLKLFKLIYLHAPEE